MHRYQDGWHDGGVAFGWLHLLLLLALIGAVVFVVMMLLRMRQPGVIAPPSAPRVDQALAELRLRYARGEIDRDDYLRRAVDLGDTNATEAPPGAIPEG
jgi:putative membrane protein